MRTVTNCCFQHLFHKSLQLHLTVEGTSLQSADHHNFCQDSQTVCGVFALLKHFIRAHEMKRCISEAPRFWTHIFELNPSNQANRGSWAFTAYALCQQPTPEPCANMCDQQRMEPNKKLFIQINSISTTR